jgi:hypothetical protein
VVIEPNGKISGRTTKFWPDLLPDFVREQVFTFCWKALEQPPSTEEEWKNTLDRMRKLSILETDINTYNNLNQDIL